MTPNGLGNLNVPEHSEEKKQIQAFVYVHPGAAAVKTKRKAFIVGKLTGWGMLRSEVMFHHSLCRGEVNEISRGKGNKVCFNVTLNIIRGAHFQMK